MIIVIDPGHGGTARVGGSSPNNATGPNGLLEKAVTLDVALRLHARFQSTSHQVLLTRDSDTNLGLADRARVARDNNADAFVSIHCNGAGDATIQGTETWIHNNATRDSDLLAGSVQQRLVAATGHRDRGVKKANFGVLNPRHHLQATAACLAEISFLTDPAEELRLGQEAYKDGIAEALEQALLDFEARAARELLLAAAEETMIGDAVELAAQPGQGAGVF